MRRPLLIPALLVQAFLLFWNLDLLPVWTDELHTVQTVSVPFAQIPGRVAADIHPPLYFLLLRGWAQAPLPGTAIARLRAFSGLWALLATVAIWRLWLGQADGRTRGWFLALWTLSPCLLLYGRMARSYSMQVFLASVALFAALKFVEKPGRRRALAYAAANAVLLYTHYLPGAAVLVAVAAVLAWRRAFRPLLLAAALIVLAYLPWLITLRDALGKWAGQSGVYKLLPNAFLDQLVKLAYWFVSFNFGESLPGVAIVAGALLAPLILWLLVKGLRSGQESIPLMAAAAVGGYIGVSRWVSFPFLPARLLFLLPFYFLLLLKGRERAGRAGTIACAALAALPVLTIPSYFARANYLNKGYAAPFREIAALIRPNARALVIVDTFNTDSQPLVEALRLNAPPVLVRDESAPGEIERRGREAETIWYIRNTHDVSPGGLNRRIEAELARIYPVRAHFFQAYSPWERLVIRLAGWPEQPTHFYQVLEMRRKTGQ